ncbi:MAG TPA: hypothetical protein VLD35_15215 [Caldimonas sp.]|nr:hypothetical protein [Caldimonas sp.]
MSTLEAHARFWMTLVLAGAIAGCGGGGSAADVGAEGAASDPTSPGAAASFQVGGTARGLGGTGLVLLNNGSDTLAVPADGSFAFATPLASGATFNVSIASQPGGQFCALSNASGTVTDAPVDAIGVTCTTVAAGGGGAPASGTDPLPAISASPGSADLIGAALAAGTLTKEQALIYAMYAEYRDPRLPAAYLGDDVGLIEGTAHAKVLEHIAEVGLANVSQATLDALRPFFIPAYLEGSYERASAVNPHGKSALTVSRPQGAKAGWTPVAGTNVVVWYETSRAASDAANAAMLVAEFDNTIWPMLTGLMKRTPKSDLHSAFFTEIDGRLDISLEDLPGTIEGRTIPVDWIAKNTAVKIVLRRDVSGPVLQAQAAHEFMHAIQFAIDVKASSMPAYATIREATAAWATHYVYPRNGWETQYAKHYLNDKKVGLSYDDPRDSEKVKIAFRYGAYLLPLFLETRFGAGIVRDIWDRTVGDSRELDALAGAILGNGSTFDDEWRKFIAFCWNQQTINDATRLYAATGIVFKDAPSDPKDLEQDSVVSLAGGYAEVAHDVNLPHASMGFYRVKFAGGDSRSVTFVNGITYGLDTFDSGVGNALRFTGLAAAKRKGASMQIYLKVKGAWQSAPVDVTDMPFIAVCRDNPAGKVEEVVFMYGNAEVDPVGANYNEVLVAGDMAPGLIATDIGCQDWTGRLDMQRAVDQGTGVETFKLINVKLVNAMSTAAPLPGIKPAYALAAGEQFQPGFGFIYKVVGGSVEWTYNQHIGGSTTCDYAGGKTYSITGGKAIGPFPVLTLSNYTPPGNTFRSLITAGLAINGLADFITLSADWRCTDSDGKVTTGTETGIASALDLIVTELTASTRVSAGGMLISGTGAQTQAVESGDRNVSGTWSLTAVP